MAKTQVTPDAYFAALDEPHKNTALALRALVLGTEPDVEEVIKYGIPFFVRKGMVCYLNVNKSGVTLGFTSGTQLSDSFGLFTGKNLKMIRHIVIPSIAFIDEKRDEIMNYVIEALAINDAKAKT